MKKYARLVIEIEIDDNTPEETIVYRINKEAEELCLSIDDIEIHEQPYNSEYED